MAEIISSAPLATTATATTAGRSETGGKGLGRREPLVGNSNKSDAPVASGAVGASSSSSGDGPSSECYPYHQAPSGPLHGPVIAHAASQTGTTHTNTAKPLPSNSSISSSSSSSGCGR
mmetsp:Transcript_31522/g.69245  ORF Transcript_31522/g.69245 Transcript_31522/m.69245 type:complete len:118 (+) Transcript_31522:406-759(+)